MNSTLPWAVLSRLPDEVEGISLHGSSLVVRLHARMGTAERGHMLLELEKRLHREVDPRLDVFLEPRGDMEKLRAKLRGGVIK